MVYSKAGLRITGKFDPDKLTKDLELSPSFVNYSGKKDKFGETYKFNIWGLTSPLEKSVPLDDHLKWLIKRCKEKYEIFRKIKENNKIDIFCSITSIGQNGFSLNHKDLLIIGDLQINLEFSLIFLSEN